MESSYQTVEGFQEGDLAPIFVLKPEPLSVSEGECAKFCCRLVGNPRPLVKWFINGNHVVNGSKYKIRNDGIHQLEIPKTTEFDRGTVEVCAKNSYGETKYSTTLEIKSRSSDYRGLLKNSPKPIYDDNVAKYQLQRRQSEDNPNYEEGLKPGGVFGVWYKEKPEEPDPRRRRSDSKTNDGPMHPFHASHHFSNY